MIAYDETSQVLYVDGRPFSLEFLRQLNIVLVERAIPLLKNIVGTYYEFESEGDQTLGMCLEEIIDAARKLLEEA